jgi:hypothetical protein
MQLQCKIPVTIIMARREAIMTKINREKIVRAVIGSARLEGYKGSLKETTMKKAEGSRTEAKPKAPAKR